MKTRAQKEREARHWQARKGRSQKHFEAGSGTPEKEEVPKQITTTDLKGKVTIVRPYYPKKYQKEKVNELHGPAKKVTTERLNDKAEKSGIDRSFTKGGKLIEQDTQLKPTALVVINYKTGTQGYPENVEAFEEMVAEQEPHRHEPTDLLSKREWQGRGDEARIRLGDMRTDKWVLEMLASMRFPKPTQVKRGKSEKKELGMKGGDFSQTTIDWFKDHPADLIYLSEHEEARTEAKRWQGFKGGIKSKGGGRPKKYHSATEKRKAKAEGQRRRAKEARKQK